MPNAWYEFEELTREPFLAINVTNSSVERREKNEGLLLKQQTGDWVMPSEALDAGLEGKLAALVFARGRERTLYLGRIEKSRRNGQDERGWPRYRLTVDQPWQAIGSVDCSFTGFFPDFSLGASPVAIWVSGDAVARHTNAAQSEADTSEALLREQDPLIGWNELALAPRRVNHSEFVRRVLNRWGQSCALTGIDRPGLVQACHIKPWSACDETPCERLDANNGLPLCIHLHYALDNFLISFANDGRLLVAQEVEPALRQLLLAENAGRLHLVPTPEQQHYLEWHRTHAIDVMHRVLFPV